MGDFGLSKMKDEGKTMTSVGSPLWIAPEVLKGEVYGQGCDIYRWVRRNITIGACGLSLIEQLAPATRSSSPLHSFGIIIWELCAWKEPYEGLSSMAVTNSVVRGTRPEVPRDCPTEIVEVMQKCWLEDQYAR